MSTGRVALRVFLAGAVAKMLLIRRAASGNFPTLTRFILAFDPLATWIANGTSGQASNLILLMVFGLECVFVFYAVRWFLSPATAFGVVKVYELNTEQWVASPRDEVFAFFSDAANLEAITPPWLKFEIATPRPIAMRVGTLIDYKLRFRGIPMKWRTEITKWNPPHSFEDIQLRGPYALWRHTHTFEEARGGTLLRDRVEYSLPLGILGRIVHTLQVRQNVRTIFNYRYDVIRERFGGPERPL